MNEREGLENGQIVTKPVTGENGESYAKTLSLNCILTMVDTDSVSSRDLGNFVDTSKAVDTSKGFLPDYILENSWHPNHNKRPYEKATVGVPTPEKPKMVNENKSPHGSFRVVLDEGFGEESAEGWESKIWGRTKLEEEENGPLPSQKHRLELKKGFCCSVHYHENRKNYFLVNSGIVRIVWCYGNLVNYADLGKGDMWSVPSRVVHQFQVIESGEMIEIYTPDRMNSLGEPEPLETNDIFRLSTGRELPVNFFKLSPGFCRRNSC